MDWTKLSVYTTTAGIDPVTGIMLLCGAGGFEIEDAEDFKELTENPNLRFDYLDENLKGFGTRETCVACYLAGNDEGKEQEAQIREQIDLLGKTDADKRFGRLLLKASVVREEDWADCWKQYYKPFPVGKRLLIKPTWEECTEFPGRAVLEIDPGSSFGTGQHETTKLCLLMLDEMISGGEKLLDLGCGSGILSIAALLLGASFALGVDIDRNAADVAVKNARQNGIRHGGFRALFGNLTENAEVRDQIGEGYDIITANIVSDVLIEMAPFFRLFLKTSGTLIASGIIEQRAGEVAGALEREGFFVKEQKRDNGWSAFRFIWKD